MFTTSLLRLLAKARLADAARLLTTTSRTVAFSLRRFLAGDDAGRDDALGIPSHGMAVLANPASPIGATAVDGASVRTILALLGNALFIGLALAYAGTTTAFGCSGSVSSGGGGTTPPNDPNRALGTYRVSGTFNESQSRIFFGYWFSSQNNISIPEAQAFRAAMIPIANTARVTIVPSSILYEETAVSVDTGQLVTVSISGTWAYESLTTIQANWGSAFVTASTFPTTPPFQVATVGTLLEGPMPNDIVFAPTSAWGQLESVEPGPLDGIFVRDSN